MDIYLITTQFKLLQIIGAVAIKGSKFGKPDRAIHYSFVLCNGNEQTLTNCTKITHSFKEGRTIYRDAQTAGVKCLPYRPISHTTCLDDTVIPTGNPICVSGSIQLNSGNEGRLEYCYHGHWSVFCQFTHREAIVACRQLGFTKYSCKLAHINL